MTVENLAPAGAPTLPRFDAKFIEDHRLIDKYLEHTLPVKGARELENWCRSNPDYLHFLKLSERTQASLALLEASGRPLDLTEPTTPWWKSPFLLIGLAVVTLASLLAFWALFAKFALLRSALADERLRAVQGSLVQPAVERDTHVSPDHAPGINHARIQVSRSAPQLVDVHIDMNYTKANVFRMIVDKQDQGRALILAGLLKDSNGELRLTVNTTGLAAGTYVARIEAQPARGNPIAEGWLLLDVQ